MPKAKLKMFKILFYQFLTLLYNRARPHGKPIMALKWHSLAALTLPTFGILSDIIVHGDFFFFICFLKSILASEDLRISSSRIWPIAEYIQESVECSQSTSRSQWCVPIEGSHCIRWVSMCSAQGSPHREAQAQWYPSILVYLLLQEFYCPINTPLVLLMFPKSTFPL